MLVIPNLIKPNDIHCVVNVEYDELHKNQLFSNII